VDLASLELGGKASILFWVNLNLVIMGISPIGKWNIGGFKKMKNKQCENLSKTGARDRAEDL
jgi:hypothetical protein